VQAQIAPDVPCRRIGTTGRSNFLTGGEALLWRVTPTNLRSVEIDMDVQLDDLRRAHEAFLPELMGVDGALA